MPAWLTSITQLSAQENEALAFEIRHVLPANAPSIENITGLPEALPAAVTVYVPQTIALADTVEAGEDSCDCPRPMQNEGLPVFRG